MFDVGGGGALDLRGELRERQKVRLLAPPREVAHDILAGNFAVGSHLPEVTPRGEPLGGFELQQNELDGVGGVPRLQLVLSAVDGAEPTFAKKLDAGKGAKKAPVLKEVRQGRTVGNHGNGLQLVLPSHLVLAEMNHAGLHRHRHPHVPRLIAVHAARAVRPPAPGQPP
ncbi:aspartate 1-decarboxylase [Babesia caballi]|uniref:Aspartate 1-decarboxylase n=1 Tax=Babesia caballi TaxID=5871 RepID=A0AAV4LSC4_BABCB|nr:aspartate 1-decarboxylase [Babesia caballi]